MSEETEVQLAKPWIAHILATISILTLLFAFSLRIFVGDAAGSLDIPAIAGIPMTIAIFWLIAWMAADVMGGRRTSNRVAWLVLVLCVPVIGALIYYFARWLPAQR